jgi:hypothetical protein
VSNIYILILKHYNLITIRNKTNKQDKEIEDTMTEEYDEFFKPTPCKASFIPNEQKAKSPAFRRAPTSADVIKAM